MLDLSKRYSGMVFALATACGLGAITTMAKLFYSAGGDAITLMLVRLLASTLVFGLLLLIRRSRFTVDRAQRLPLLLIGLFWSGGMICYLSAVETLSVSLAVLVFYSYPLLVLVYSIINRQLKASAGLVGLFFLSRELTGLPLSLGAGYEVFRDWLFVERDLALWLLFAIFVIRALASAFTATGSGVGGVFIPLVVGEDMTAFKMTMRLQEEGVFANPVVSPAVPPVRSMSRTSYMAPHTRQHLDQAVTAIEKVGRGRNIIA